jgi:AcrR family transcriptional regulator
MSSQAAKPSRMSAEERREQLLDATKEIVDRQGFHAVSIEAVARAAGITRPIVYSHFGDLAGLLEALIERETGRALAQLATVLPADLSAGDPKEQLLAGLRGYLRAAESDPITWRLALMPPEGAPEILREQIARGRAAVIDLLAKAVGTGMGGEQASPDPELTARMLSSFSDDAVRLLLTEPERYPAERVLAHAEWVLERFLGR